MRYLTAIVFFLAAQCAFGQRPEFKQKYLVPENYRMIGVNASPLLVQLVPFNKSNPLTTGPFNVTFHRFVGTRAFHTALGFNIPSEGEDTDFENIHLNFRMGITKRKPLGGRWTYFSGFDLYFSAGGLNLRADPNDDEKAIAALGPRWAIGYAIEERLLLSIETAAVLGFDLEFGIPEFRFIPPVALSLNFILPR
ncbi:MAG: hypothetical protein D6816_13445 [Bacteroidetes bacterium]|nr:MAG: hypothetical protein D6816_13445 [Bacteroidota bacterium]